MNIDDMKESKYLRQQDVGRGVLVTIKGLSEDNIEKDDQADEHVWLLHFHELDKPLVLKPTNAALCAQACGSKETDYWIGKRIVLYTDPNVSFGGKITGGIRVRAPRLNPVPVSAPMNVENPSPPVQPIPAGHPVNDDIPF